MESLFIVMPAYNEEANIESVVRQWYPLLKDKAPTSRLVVADSGSTDRTHTLLRKMQMYYPQLVVLTNTPRQHGPKLMALYHYAIQQHADYIFQTDSDGQTSPEEFSGFWRMRLEYDIILGWRTNREDGWMRTQVEDVVCFLLKLYFGVKAPDANAPFRLMRADILRRYLPLLPVHYALPNIILTALFLYNNEKTAFRMISFHGRQRGKNAINIPRILQIGGKAMLDFRRFRKTCMPKRKLHRWRKHWRRKLFGAVDKAGQ